MDEENDLLQQAGGEGDTGGAEGGDANEGHSPEVLQRAREMGWVPQEEWKGPAEKWSDADEYVRKGEEVLPIIRANNRKLSQQLSAKDQEIARLRQSHTELQESVKAIQEIQSREATGRVDRAIRNTRRQIEEARSERDTEKVIELQETLDELEEEKETLSAGKPANKGQRQDGQDDDDTPRPNPQLQQELQDWTDENTWYGTDKLRTKLVNAAASEVKAKNPKLVGKAFLDACVAQVDAEFPELGQPRGVSKTAGGSASGSRSTPSTSKGKSYRDLPADARSACDKDATRVVGEGKMFKTKDAYQAWYVKEYFGEAS